jgi:lysophospholipase L1-like esterase
VRLDRRLGPIGALAIALVVFIAAEGVLQARRYIRTGESFFDAMAAAYNYATDPHTGVRLLRASARLKIGGEVETNSWGLRTSEMLPTPRPGEHRIAVLGASTVFGIYAKSNRDTPAAYLERALNESSGGGYTVINAGVPGLTVADQVALLERRLLPAGVAEVVWYAGQNDISCGRRKEVEEPMFDLGWLMTYQLAEKNLNVIVKEARNRAAADSDGARIDYEALEATLRRGVRSAQAAGTDVVLVTVATLYDKSLSADRNEKFARDVLHFKPCLTASAVVAAKERLNAIIRRVARDEHTHLFDAAARFSGRTSYFGDSTHFSSEGSRAFGALLADELVSADVL